MTLIRHDLAERRPAPIFYSWERSRCEENIPCYRTGKGSGGGEGRGGKGSGGKGLSKGRGGKGRRGNGRGKGCASGLP